MADDSIQFEVVDSNMSDLFGQQANTSPIKTTVAADNMTMDQKIREYVAKYNPKLYILTPCYGGTCFVNYVHCMMATVELFRMFNIQLKVEFCKNDSLVTRARNNLVARAMYDPKMTHLMFIDADITWDPIDILKLLISNKPLIGGVYPLKHHHWEKLVKDPQNPYNSNMVQTLINKKNNSQFKDSISDVDMIQYSMVNYNVNYLSNTLKIEDNLAKVKHLATGFMMIQRKVFEKMFQAFPSTKYVDDVSFLRPEENEFAYGTFETGVYNETDSPGGSRYLSEDFFFCLKWSKLSGEIYIDVSINLTHSGICDFKGSYISSII